MSRFSGDICEGSAKSCGAYHSFLMFQKPPLPLNFYTLTLRLRFPAPQRHREGERAQSRMQLFADEDGGGDDTPSTHGQLGGFLVVVGIVTI